MPPALGQVFAYTYSDPLLEVVPDASIWGWEVDRVYQDQGTRQQLQQLLQDCRTESVAYLLVRHLNELGDSLTAIRAILAKLEALQIQLITTEDAIGLAEPSICPSDLMQLFQTIQTQQQRQQLRRGHARNRLKALPPPGRAPYGYRRGKDRYALDRSTAPVVKDFFDHFLLYGSLRGSVRYLQKKYSKKISVSTGKRWLTSPVYRGDLAEQQGIVRRPIIPADCQHNAHIYYLLVENLEVRTALIAHLKRKGIQSTFHYVPLHSAPAGLKYGRATGELSVTDDLSDRLIRLPLGAGMTLTEAKYVSEEVLAFFNQQS
ncbi:DegT/DnrJ/EryC1/StrS family aminotransferase [Leptolyngbya sp. 7M]|uniref:DegT/DnrJ/EryC1/StrS family aminotransferase n=1 Tax=Leptolyngbya sp. 7M TaxID=2812896 RepID=UPI001B8BFED7|nr:DegT/DnrJ/EryC1/StrS family aminotransferase [Leptolyngbya sp. 7M]QYO63282.1 DegT/DnrJ/EryC1/StrS family aminotransferase [Leptolyngbya sp. 7M]